MTTMHVITKTEYDELVEELSHRAFDPLSDDAAVARRSNDLIDYVLSDEHDSSESTSRLHDMIVDAIEGYDWTEYGSDALAAFHRLPATVHGGIVDHAGKARRLGGSDRFEGVVLDRVSPNRPGHAEARVADLAFAMLAEDVHSEAASRIRSVVGDRKREQRSGA